MHDTLNLEQCSSYLRGYRFATRDVFLDVGTSDQHGGETDPKKHETYAS